MRFAKVRNRPKTVRGLFRDVGPAIARHRRQSPDARRDAQHMAPVNVYFEATVEPFRMAEICEAMSDMEVIEFFWSGVRVYHGSSPSLHRRGIECECDFRDMIRIEVICDGATAFAVADIIDETARVRCPGADRAIIRPITVTFGSGSRFPVDQTASNRITHG